LQIVASAGVSYISQPDLSIPNTPERRIQGDLIYSTVRLDASYRFSPRASLTLTGSNQGTYYTESSEQVSNSNEFTVGIEARYLWKPRWTLLTEFRHAMRVYENDSSRDSTSEFLLVGSEFVLSPRLNGSLRVGVTRKVFDLSEDSQISPYLESAVTYRSTARSSVVWTNRFGFEEPAVAGQERLVYRSTINYVYAFSPKVRGSAAINLLHEVTTADFNDDKFAQDTFDMTLGVDYQWTRKFSVNGSYSFTITNSNTKVTDYYRNRVSIGAQYEF
jgi:hypothetical protein